jgi:hypothetical protein
MMGLASHAPMFLELVKGVALLLALCFLHGVNIRALAAKWPWLGQIVSGLLFGGICVLGMLNPVVADAWRDL